MKRDSDGQPILSARAMKVGKKRRCHQRENRRVAGCSGNVGARRERLELPCALAAEVDRTSFDSSRAPGTWTIDFNSFDFFRELLAPVGLGLHLTRGAALFQFVAHMIVEPRQRWSVLEPASEGALV